MSIEVSLFLFFENVQFQKDPGFSLSQIGVV